MHTDHLILPLFLLASGLSAGLAAQSDIVLRKDGAKMRGVEVTEFKFEAVVAKKGDEETRVPGHMVFAVEWGGLPESFTIARAALDRGDYETATQLFGEAAEKAERPLVKADAEFFQVKAAVAAIGADKGAAETAAERARAWVTANADHWRLPEAMLLLGRALRLAVKGDDAAQVLRDLDNRAINEGFGAVWSARAKYELALTLAANGKPGEARTQFQAANSAADTALATKSPDEAELNNIKILARIGEGETFLTEKDYRRAESYFHGLTTSPEQGLAAAAWAGEGEAVFLGAAGKDNPGELRRAQLALAQGVVLDSTSGEASAKANYYLGRCQLELGQEREGDGFKARANSYFQIVVQSYPKSRWADEAKAALQQ
ncbi:MAG: hypothetical protein KDE27_12515 [Planctomycetes bacterium]|nr:hypothetical protein [Planctomycetota bacterium]